MDHYYLDDILIDNAPTPNRLFTNPTNNGMKAKWGKSTALILVSIELLYQQIKTNLIMI